MSVTQAERRVQPNSPYSTDSDISAEQQAARDRAKAQQRKWMAANLGIRIVSLVIVLGGWEYVGRQINPVLFTYPTAVGAAAIKMIGSGELWQYLSQSLIVLGAGLALAVVFGIALGVIMYDRTRVLNRLEDPFEFARVAHIWKVYDKQKLVELHSRCTLEGLAPKIRCPLLVVHGTKDFVPVEQAKRIYDEASGPKEWLLLEGGNHVCNNMPFRYRPAISDFLAKHLEAKTR